MAENSGTAIVSSRVPLDQKTLLYALAKLERTTASALLRELMKDAIQARLAAQVARRGDR